MIRSFTAEQPAGGTARRPYRSVQHSDQCTVADLLPLDRRWAVRGGDHRLPL